MPPAEITRAETSERRGCCVRPYDVDPRPDRRGGEAFGSTSVIRFDCAEPGAASYADLIAAGCARSP